MAIGRTRPAVVVYTRQGCGLCRTAEALAAAEARRAHLEFVDIDADDALQRRYHVRVPVVTVDGEEIAEGHVEPGTIRRAVRRARWRPGSGPARQSS